MAHVLLLSLSLALVILGGLLLRHGQLRRQAKRIQQAAEAFARGDMSARAGTGHGSVSALERAFDGMASRVEEENRALKSTQAELERLVATDRLTGVGNRRAFDQLAELEVAKSNRYGVPASLILFDIDHFKQINDEYGHTVGDSVLVRIARRVSGRLRDTDSIARWGGEEFAVLTPCTPISGAYVVAEAIRRAVEAESFSPVGRVTISLGIAQLARHETAAFWVARADELLYLAKQRGRNRTCLSENVAEQSMPFTLVWGDQFLTGIEQIDREHAEVFRLANDLLLQHPSSKLEDTLACFDLLCEHLERHFESEEHLLRDLDCADVDAHASMHRGILSQAMDQRRRLLEGQVDPFDVRDFVVRHLAIGHLVSEDLPLLASLKPSATVPVAHEERPSLRIRLQRAIRG